MKLNSVKRLEKIEQTVSATSEPRVHRLEPIKAGPIDAPIAREIIEAKKDRQIKALIESGVAQEGDRFIVRLIVTPPPRAPEPARTE